MPNTLETQLDRREFTLRAALLALSGVTITVSACGGGDGGNPNNPNSGDKVGSVSANHGHTAVIAAAELTAGRDINLSIAGSAGHPHSVALTAAELSQIAGGTRVSKNSTTDDGHNHQVTFN